MTLTTSERRRLNYSRDPLSPLLHIDLMLVLAVLAVARNFARYALSVAGARGLMPIMPFWLSEIGRPNDNLLHIDTNLRFGCTILKYYLDQEKGDLKRALGRYNGSLGKREYPNKVLDKLRLKWYRA